MKHFKQGGQRRIIVNIYHLYQFIMIFKWNNEMKWEEINRGNSIFATLIFSVEPDIRTGRLLVFLLCWVRFVMLFLIKKDFLIPWVTILLFFINPFRMEEKVGSKNQVCLYVFHRKYFNEFFTRIFYFIFVSLFWCNLMQRGKLLRYKCLIRFNKQYKQC